MRPQPRLLFKTVPYPKCLKGVLDLNDLLDVVGNGGNDLINEMDHAVGCMVVSLQQPGTVNSYNLPERGKVEWEGASRRRSNGPQLGAECLQRTPSRLGLAYSLSNHRTEP